ncbi:MAG: ORC1-type DNA replication protein, partial [Candidatus Bathyarchaeota archaeon]
VLSICRLLKENASAYISMGEVEKEYNVVCEEFGEKARAHVQLWKYVKSLSLTGIISTKSSSKGHRGKTTLIGLPVSAEKLEKEILKIIGH